MVDLVVIINPNASISSVVAAVVSTNADDLSTINHRFA